MSYKLIMENGRLRQSRDYHKEKRKVAKIALNRQHQGIEYWKARALVAEEKLAWYSTPKKEGEDDRTL